MTKIINALAVLNAEGNEEMLAEFKDRVLIHLLARLADKKGRVYVSVADIDDPPEYDVNYIMDSKNERVKFIVRKK